MSWLRHLRALNPDYNWPPDPEPRNYSQEMGAELFDRRRFGFSVRKLIYRTSSERSALEYAKANKGVITFNPVRLEAYGVWV